MRLPIVLLAALAVALSAAAEAGQGNDRRTTRAETDYSIHFPVSFRSERGGRFEPERMVIVTRQGAWEAALPSRAREVRRADHLDFSGVPLIGPFFRERTAPQDAERHGLPVGPVARVGDTLVLDARGHATPLTNLRVTLTSDLPRLGPMAFDLGALAYGPAAAAPGSGVRVGEAYLLDGRLVLAGDGRRPPLRF
ncbi:MAG TPA: hypothetical protein VMM55_02220 [Thermohalobaculum sp.]|nr:hypothetical protein [Thermohalobaculum sp.]